ncbi:copper resistance protein CopC [Rathayibacter iranicus]|uniref:copper resistance protein CopC n=1 Tax=Rathayibacter iranicus TaxID=59737 RepID=UPI0013E346AC
MVITGRLRQRHPAVGVDAARAWRAGAYEVTWQVVSTDGHPVLGQYTFVWAPGDRVALVEGAEAVPDCNGTVVVGQGPVDVEEHRGGRCGLGVAVCRHLPCNALRRCGDRSLTLFRWSIRRVCTLISPEVARP